MNMNILGVQGNTPLTMVDDFHFIMDQPSLDYTHVPTPDRVALRRSLIEEEFRETMEAFDLIESTGAADKREALIALADGLADLQYVLNGAALEFGINLDSVFEEVHRSNMAKLHEDGTVHYREDGKVLKPEGWTAPDLAPILFPTED